MAEGKLFLLVGITSLLSCDAFYQSKLAWNLPTVYPTSISQLKWYLADNTARKIVINQMFDFTNAEGTASETGCYHDKNTAQCPNKGQQKLNVNNQCAGLTSVRVTYGKAGISGLAVGSNKVIVGQNGGGLKGKGLRLDKSQNVEIRNLKIIDVNAHVVWGGEAIDMVNVYNVLIDGCYIKNIGRQMIVTHYGACTGVTISNSVFDGYSPWSTNCQGNHFWLWLFAGAGDQITLQNNVIFGTSGRGPKIQAVNGKKSLVHIFQNIFYDIKDCGLLELTDTTSSVIIEGNVFVNVAKVVFLSSGKVFIPQNANDANACVAYLGRACLLNTVVNSQGTWVKNSNTALADFKAVRYLLAKPIVMKNSITNLVAIPNYVRQHIR